MNSRPLQLKVLHESFINGWKGTKARPTAWDLYLYIELRLGLGSGSSLEYLATLNFYTDVISAHRHRNSRHKYL